MKKIIIKKTETGFSVTLPFDLKDNFRENFKTAKWNATNKTWNVGSRSGKKLEQWADIANANLPTDAEIQDYDERVMLQAEIENLAAQAKRIKNALDIETKKIDDADELKELAEEARAELMSAQAELDTAKTRVATAKAAAKQEADAVFAMLNGLIDVSAAKSAAHTMSRAMRSHSSHAHQEFYDAKECVLDMRNALSDADLCCEAIEFIAKANKNRPDRDNPSFVTEKMWLNIWKITEDD